MLRLSTEGESFRIRCTQPNQGIQWPFPNPFPTHPKTLPRLLWTWDLCHDIRTAYHYATTPCLTTFAKHILWLHSNNNNTIEAKHRKYKLQILPFFIKKIYIKKKEKNLKKNFKKKWYTRLGVPWPVPGQHYGVKSNVRRRCPGLNPDLHTWLDLIIYSNY